MKKRTTIMMVIALLVTAGLGVYAEIHKTYADELEFMVQEQRLMLSETESKNKAIKESARRNAAEAKVAENEYQMVQKNLKDCKTGK